MEYCFIEKWHSSYRLPDGSKAVALTPNASYQLDKAGIEYVTFGDYFSSGEIRGDTDSYLESQVSWLKEFDQFVKKLFPDAKKLDIGLPSLYFHNIKYMVDCIVLTSRILERFITMAKPSKIWFLPQVYGEDKIGRWEYFSFGESSFYRLTPLLCRKENIAFERLNVGTAGDSAVDKKISDVKRLGTILVKEAIFAKLRVLKRKLLRRMCLLYGPALNFSRRAINVLVVREFPYTIGFYRDSKKAGFSVYYKEKDSIYKLDWFASGFKVNLEGKKDIDSARGIDFASATDNLAKSSIMRWVNEQCGLDVTPILYSRLKFFLEKVFIETIIRIRRYVEFYDKYKIDFVVSYSNSTIDDFAAVAAARASLATKSVCFSHGVDALDLRSRYFSEYFYFDYLFVSTTGGAEHIRCLADLFPNKLIKVNEYGHFRDQFSRIRRNKIKRVYGKSDKPVVLYAPIMRVERMNMPIAKAQPLQWDYFKWHKELIKYFSSRRDFHFIWKAILQYYGRGDTVADMIKDSGASNITYSTEGLRSWLPKADRALCDTPSTAFYECIFSKLPVLAMYRPNDQKLHKDAYSSYGLSLRPYSSVEEGVGIIDKYLNGNPDDYIVSLRNNDVFVPSVLYNGEKYGKRV